MTLRPARAASPRPSVWKPLALGLVLAGAAVLTAMPAPGRDLAFGSSAVRAAAPTPAPEAPQPRARREAATMPGLPPAGRPVLSVSLASPLSAPMAVRVQGSGHIQPWQEASIGARESGLQLVEVAVNVGDLVRRGQLLARLDAALLEAELAQSRAAAREARAAFGEAESLARRARQLRSTGALSGQQIEQALTAEQVALARLEAAEAGSRTLALCLQRTRILAPDDGVITARQATVGAVPPPGQELFRLIVQGRLEWRGQVAATDLEAIRPGQAVSVEPVGGAPVAGTVRKLAPAIDLPSGNGLVYVDLPAAAGLRAGGFARGRFEVAVAPALTLPPRAVQLRDGHRFVLRVGPDSRVAETRVRTGRQQDDRVEILAGLTPDDRVVLTGASFLHDGDLVRVVAGPAEGRP